MKRCIAFLAATVSLLMSLPGHTQTASYEATTRYLTLPAVLVGGTTFSNVVVRLDSFAVISVGNNTVSATCSASNFNATTYNAISAGMSLDQVNQTIGCANNSSRTSRNALFVLYRWGDSSPYIEVYFDVTGSRATFYFSTLKNASGF